MEDEIQEIQEENLEITDGLSEATIAVHALTAVSVNGVLALTGAYRENVEAALSRYLCMLLDFE
jgi:hypothetical protein